MDIGCGLPGGCLPLPAGSARRTGGSAAAPPAPRRPRRRRRPRSRRRCRTTRCCTGWWGRPASSSARASPSPSWYVSLVAPPASFFPEGTSRAPRVKTTPWRCLVAPPFPCPRLKSWHTDPTGSPAATSPPAPGGVLGWGPSLQPAFSCQDRELRPEEIEGKAWGRCPQLESPLSPTRHPFPSAHPTLWPGGVAEGGCLPVPPASPRCPQS